ncbi:MAG TPA: Jag N-terminal domain-containing protein [Candidatus Omnitrophota bacterium]|nr:Jag N-terminal domain-containing protein [Candidatus Omnitrophota bacterium]
MEKKSISIEIEAKTIEDAVKRALKEMNVKRDQVKIEVLREEEKGLFGQAGAKLAKIRVTIEH